MFTLKSYQFIFIVLSLVVSQICCISIEQGLDYPVGEPEFGGTGMEWKGVSSTSYYGGDSVQSGVCDDNEETTLTIEISETSQGSFYWKVSSKDGVGYLSFHLDDVFKEQITAEQGWSKVSFTVTSGEPHTLKWTYLKDGFGSEGDDCGWVDRLVTDRTTIGLSTSLDNEDVTCNTGGDTDWYGQDFTDLFGGSAAQSGECQDEESTWLTAEVIEKSHVSFYWKSSSEEDFDYLRFYIDNEFQDEISGDQDWTQMSYYVSGERYSHILKWVYEKDDFGIDGADCGWVDQLVIGDQTIDLTETLDNDALEFTTGGYYPWYGQDKYSYSGGSAARSGPLEEENSESWMKTTVEGEGKLHFYWKFVEGVEVDTKLTFSVDGEDYEAVFGDQDWEQIDYYIPGEGSHELKWTFSFEETSVDEQDRDLGCGLIDKIEFSNSDSDVSLNDALDNQELVFTTEGNAPWYGQKEEFHYGDSAAKSDGLKMEQTAALYTTVTGKGKLSFYWKADSESTEDSLLFVDNSKETEVISGKVDWTEVTYDLEIEGEHTLVWAYRKDSNTSIDQGFGWVDKIVFIQDKSTDTDNDDDNDDVVSSSNYILPFSLTLFASFFLFFSALF
ncbi:hypothetical protein M0812_05199 [Anaeramoeba flamelloides]|uniref:Uncharacterized protein n=1 Tax=Anaeramoeba flamelloides TaxID=1746091 RepID=A0AAV8A8F2_9EUKA|nr:hypothetical protein M0812_05199 [Anaeramoeba flamelloides]